MALAACAVILMAIYGVFSRAMHLRDNATARIREARVQARAAAVLRNDLRNARLSGGTLGGDAGRFAGAAEARSFPGYLRFTTTTAQDIVQDAQEVPASDLQRVEYYIVNDPDATDRKAGLLVRTDRARPARRRCSETPTEEPLLPGVESMESRVLRRLHLAGNVELRGEQDRAGSGPRASSSRGCTKTARRPRRSKCSCLGRPGWR